jgi:hypothetical protein
LRRFEVENKTFADYMTHTTGAVLPKDLGEIYYLLEADSFKQETMENHFLYYGASQISPVIEREV